MQALIIKDLEISKELTGKDLSAVRGGLQRRPSRRPGGLRWFRHWQHDARINTPVVVQAEVAPVTIVDINLANVIGSLGTGVSRPNSGLRAIDAAAKQVAARRQS